MQKLFFLILFAFMAWVFVAGKTSTPTLAPSAAPAQIFSTPSSAPAPLLSAPISSNFSCDGRQHCSQMNSRAEALFFIRNCPNTKMDGDNDGNPCENDSRF